jgi:hypothetical protein
MSLYSLDGKTDLNAPVLVAAFDGWVDAGQAGTLAADQLAQGGTVVASFDGDQIYDYRARRPTLDIVNGTLMSLDWPELQLRTTSFGGRDLLILSGPEPDYRWRELSTDVAGLAKRLGVTSWVSLGAIPAAVAHTRSVPVLGTASVRGLLPDGVAQGPDGRLRVPSAAISVMELAASSAGIPSLGFYAQVPHYISAAYPAAAVELLKHVGRYLALELPLGDLPAKALATRSLLDAATANDEQTRAYVEKLESMTELPTGDELIADIERYLRDGGRGGNGGSLPN